MNGETTDFTPAEAVRAARDGRLEAWVHAFLMTSGNNIPLSEGLKRARRFWYGPVRFPLALLTRCLGPEEGMEYHVSPARWEEKTEAMRASLERGWEPPPLLVQYLPGPILSIRDGNNRYGAFVRHGVTDYWTIFWFDRAADRRRFLVTDAYRLL